MRNQMSMVLLMLSFASTAGFAAEPVVGQKDKQFSQSEISVKKGDSIQFMNDDTVTHNISVKEPGGVNRPGIVQQPGVDTHLVFDKAGDHDVHCLIHPKMKMAIHVE